MAIYFRSKLLFIGALLLLGCLSSTSKKVSADGWIQLFNGKDLKDWQVKIRNYPLNENYGNTFRVENGVMKVDYSQYITSMKNSGTFSISRNFPIICSLWNIVL